jgi:hypothetical protein
MSESRSLAVLEILAHLSDVLPDKYVVVEEQHATRQLGDEWLRRGNSAALSVPSVTSGERNFLLNPEHPQFRRIDFHDPVPFRFDTRLLRMSQEAAQSPKRPQ